MYLQASPASRNEVGEISGLGADAKVEVGSFTGDLAHKFLPVASHGLAEGLFANLPELDGLVAVRGQAGTSLCYHLEATNNQAQAAFFFVNWSMPTLIEAADPYELSAIMDVELIDGSSDAQVTVTDLQQTISGVTAEDVVQAIGFSSETDHAFASDTYDDATAHTFYKGPVAGPAPSFGSFASVNVFASFELSAGDSIVLRGGVFVNENEGGSACRIPTIRLPLGGIFLDGFRSGDTSRWMSAVP